MSAASPTPRPTSWMVNVAVFIGWLVACGMVGGGTHDIDMEWNAYDWSGPKLDPRDLINLVVIALGVAVLFGLARSLRTTGLRIAALLPCLLFAAHGGVSIYKYIHQTLSEQSFGRSVFAPLWFHLTVAALFLLPTLVWSFTVLGGLRKRSHRGASQALSDEGVEASVNEVSKETPPRLSVQENANPVRVRCPGCRALNPESVKFCSECGRAI